MNEKMNTEDKVLFEKMYLEYQEVLRKIAYKYDVPPDDIEDVVQDTFVAYAYYKYDLTLPPNRKKILLTRILQSLPEFVVSKERCQAILEEIDKMPESWREIAVLRLIEGRPTREVCEILNISEKACYSRVSRIRKYFEDLFKKDNWP